MNLLLPAIFQIHIQTKNYIASIMQMRKPNLVYIQIPATVISLTPGGDVI